MAITLPKPKPKPASMDDFIGAAPDSSPVGTDSSVVPTKILKAKRGTNRSQVSVVLADELVARIDQQAQKNYMSRSALITMALNQFLERAQGA